jgi:hypothetical protein
MTILSCLGRFAFTCRCVLQSYRSPGYCNAEKSRPRGGPYITTFPLSKTDYGNFNFSKKEIADFFGILSHWDALARDWTP